MAFITSSIIGNSITFRSKSTTLSDYYNYYSNPNIGNIIHKFNNKSSSNRSFKLRKARSLTITNVATTPLLKVAPPLPETNRKESGRFDELIRSSTVHVAWTSVPQERWEGKLVVDGEIPLWLVLIN